MSQFKTLIEEHEEAKRNFEQLKAEMGSINSGLGDPSNSSLKVQQKASTANEPKNSEIQSTSTPAYEVELAASEGHNLPACLSDSILPSDSASQTKTNEPNLKPANTAPGTSPDDKPQPHLEPGDSCNDRLQCSDTVKRTLFALVWGVVVLLCCPCPISGSSHRRGKRGAPMALGPLFQHTSSAQTELSYEYFPPQITPGPLAPSGDLTFHPELAAYPKGPVETAYQNLETYGPEGVFEIPIYCSNDTIPVLPAPVELGGYYYS